MIKHQPTGLSNLPKERRVLTLMTLWHMGYDTTDIAVLANVSEAAVYNYLSKQREVQRVNKSKQSASSG